MDEKETNVEPATCSLCGETNPSCNECGYYFSDDPVICDEETGLHYCIGCYNKLKELKK